MRFRLIMGLVAVIAVSAVANAAPNLEFSIGMCAAQKNAKERLACYDAIAARLKAGEMHAAATPVAPAAPAPVAPAAAPVVPPAPAAVAAMPAAPAPAPFVQPPAAAPAPAAAPEAQFGAERMAKETRAETGQPEEIEEIHGAIKTIAFRPNGRAVVTLDNGQVWRQIDGDSTQFRAKEGEAATIARAIFGSYNLTVEGHNQLVKVQRVR